MNRTDDDVDFCFVEFTIDDLSRINEYGIWTLILELNVPNFFSSISLSVVLLISSLLLLSESISVIILWFFCRRWRLMVPMCESVSSCLLLSFLVFVYFLSRLCTLYINATGMRESLTFCFLVATFITVAGLSLFLVIHLLLQQYIPPVEGPKVKESLLFGTFVVSWYDGKCFATVFWMPLLLLVGRRGPLLILAGRSTMYSAMIRWRTSYNAGANVILCVMKKEKHLSPLYLACMSKQDLRLGFVCILHHYGEGLVSTQTQNLELLTSPMTFFS